MSEPTCYLSFPDDASSTEVADRLRSDLERRNVTVLPPVTDDATMSTSTYPFYWLRLADAVVVDVTGDSTWVAYEAGAAKALNKTVITIAQPSAQLSPIRFQLPRVLTYEREQIGALADYVTGEVVRSLSSKS